MSQKKIGVLLSYVQIAVTILVNLLYTPVMLRLLGQSEYGVYSLSNSVIGYFALLYMGMTSTYMRYYSRYEKQGDHQAVAKLNGLFLVLFSALGCLALAMGVLASQHLELFLGSGLTADEYRLARVLFVIMAVNMALLMPKTVFSTIVIAQERFVFIKFLDIVYAGLIPLASLPLLYLGYGSVGMSCAVLSVTAITLLASMCYCAWKLDVPFQFRKLPFSLLPGMFSFSAFIFLQGIMDQLNWQLGKVLLSNFADSTAIAVYSVGLQIDLLFINFAGAFSGVVVPQIYQLVQESATDKLTQLWIKVGRYQFFVVYFIWVGFLFFGKAFIRLWAGAEYADAYLVALLLMTPILLHLCQVLAMEILRAYNKHKMWTVIHFVFAAIGFLICIPLVKMYGVLGVAIGIAASSFVVVHGFDVWYYAKVGKLGMKAFFLDMKGLFPAAFIVAVIAAILSNFIEITGWNIFALDIGFFIVAYACVMYTLGMNRNERQLVHVGIQKMLHKK